MNKKLGRPKLAKQEQKSSTLILRLSGLERQLIEQAADRASVKLSRWMRAKLLEAAARAIGSCDD